VRYSSLVLASLVLSGCESAQKITSHLEVATPITLTAKQISSVRVGIVKSLKDHDLEVVSVGRIRAGRVSTGVIVCGYVKSKNSSGEYMDEKPFQGLFLGLDNASGFVVTGTGGAGDDTAATLEVCRRSGLDLAPS
jgi:hypothetical protein